MANEGGMAVVNQNGRCMEPFFNMVTGVFTKARVREKQILLGY
jgi:hypothetical protein